MTHHRRNALFIVLAVQLMLAACSDAAPVATPALPALQAPATSTPRLTTQAVVQVPLPTATMAQDAKVAKPVAPATATRRPSPTDEPISTATETPLPATQTPTPLAVVENGWFGSLTGNIVPDAVITNSNSGFSTTMLVSMTQVQLVDNQPVTTVIAYDVSVPPPPVAPVALPPGTINIALLGVDTRPREGGMNTDVIIIASVHPTLPVVSMLSIPRDTLVYIPNVKMHKVNTAFRNGGKTGGELLFKQTIKYNFGLNIDYFAMVNFVAVVDAVNTVGGIEVVATCPLYQVFPRDPFYYADEANPLVVNRVYTDTFTGEVWQPGMLVPTQTISVPTPGVYGLNGLQALAFARARYGVPGGDIDRGRRTQRVIRALLRKARSNVSLTQIPELYGQFERNVRTDLALSDIVALSGALGRLDEMTIRNRYLEGVGFTSITLPVVGSVLIPNRDYMTTYVEQALAVNENVRANESVPVELWNATANPDLTIAVADRLAELGFRVVATGTAEPSATSRIIDFSQSSKGSAIPLLTRSFGLSGRAVSRERQAAPSGARYRIVAGDDLNPCYFGKTSSVTRGQTLATPDPNATPVPEAQVIAPQPAPEQAPPPAPQPPAADQPAQPDPNTAPTAAP
jgi:anionic cell wall polymer biosynthesis LytR-Cps2A-Psr (LCP) family protein